jgi:hypothetical protein
MPECGIAGIFSAYQMNSSDMSVMNTIVVNAGRIGIGA